MSRQSGVVLVELLEGKETGTNVHWQVHLYLVEGKAIACRIYSKIDGRVLFTNDEAMRWLSKWGQREFGWQLKPLTLQQAHALSIARPPLRELLPPPRRATPVQYPYVVPSARDGAAPQRLAAVEQSAMRSWPRQHRRVLALVDGERSVEKIAAMLKLSPETVKKILNDLRAIGAIQK